MPLILFWHIKLAFLSALLIKLSAMSFLDSLYIWLITLKSKFYIVHLDLYQYYIYRVLLACVRNLGHCPCPRCLIKGEYINGLGTKVDRQRRAKLRKCDRQYQAKIEDARKIIYEKGYVVNSKAVDQVIGSESLTPSRVSSAAICMYVNGMT